jgi:hypothetical protein
MLGAMRLRPFFASMCLTVAACHTWQVQSGPSSSAVALAAADSTKPVRLTLTSGADIEITAPHVVGDSIVGLNRSTGQRVAFAVGDVHSVARQQVSAGRTALAAGGVTAVVLAALVVAAAVAVVAALSSF